LEDAEEWIQLRNILQDQSQKAREIRTKLSRYDDEDKVLEELRKTIDDFADVTSNRITQLDKVSQTLIQIARPATILRTKRNYYSPY
jgi:hypothetical protein